MTSPARQLRRRVNVYVAGEHTAMWADWREFLAVTEDTMSEAVMAAIADYDPFKIWRAGKEAGIRQRDTELAV